MQETQGTWVLSLGQEDPLEVGMATPSSTLAWRTHGQRSLAATVRGVTERWKRLKRLGMHACKS